MVLEIAGWAFLALVLLIVIVLAARDFIVKRMAESFDLGLKMGILRGQLGPAQVDQMLLDSGIDPTKLPGRNAP